jgi:hypothetical protein
VFVIFPIINSTLDLESGSWLITYSDVANLNPKPLETLDAVTDKLIKLDLVPAGTVNVFP